MIIDQVLVATLTRYGVALLKTKPVPYLWTYQRAEMFFLTKTWRLDFAASAAAYESIMKQSCPLQVDLAYIPNQDDVSAFVKEKCRGQVGFSFSSIDPASTAWFSDLHDATLYKLTFS